jgi:hypothetical protein
MFNSRARRVLSFLCLSMWALCGPAHGQARDPAAAQRLLERIRPVAGARRVDEGTIIRLQNMGPAPTAANVSKVLELLQAVGTEETTAALIRLLATMYVPNARAESNATIIKTLKSYIFGPAPKFAAGALIAYSRTGYRDTLLADLDYGLKRGLIDETSYSQELALNFVTMPPGMQYDAAQRLSAKNNAFGADVLASCLHSPETIARMLPRTREVVQSLLSRHEPEMSKAVGEFGIVDVIRYGNWLEVMALLSEAQGGESRTNFVFSRLGKPDTDPRKVLAYLSSPDGRRFMQAVGSRTALVPLVARAREPASHFPAHPTFSPMTDQMNEWLKQLKD